MSLDEQLSETELALHRWVSKMTRAAGKVKELHTKRRRILDRIAEYDAQQAELRKRKKKPAPASPAEKGLNDPLPKWTP